MAAQQHTAEDLDRLSAHIGYELGAAAAANKFAHEIGAERPDIARLIDRALMPEHKLMLRDLQTGGR